MLIKVYLSAFIFLVIEVLFLNNQIAIIFIE